MTNLRAAPSPTSATPFLTLEEKAAYDLLHGSCPPHAAQDIPLLMFIDVIHVSPETFRIDHLTRLPSLGRLDEIAIKLGLQRSYATQAELAAALRDAAMHASLKIYAALDIRCHASVFAIRALAQQRRRQGADSHESGGITGQLAIYRPRGGESSHYTAQGAEVGAAPRPHDGQERRPVGGPA